jgi:hypothetical protein
MFIDLNIARAAPKAIRSVGGHSSVFGRAAGGSGQSGIKPLHFLTLAVTIIVGGIAGLWWLALNAGQSWGWLVTLGFVAAAVAALRKERP